MHSAMLPQSRRALARCSPRTVRATQRVYSALAHAPRNCEDRGKIVEGGKYVPKTEDFFRRHWVEPSSVLNLSMVQTLSTGKARTTWKQVPLKKDPIAMVQYQALLSKLRPSTIFDIGTSEGGCALWLADQCRALGLDAQIVTIDIEDLRAPHIKEQMDQDPSILFVEGDVFQIADLVKHVEQFHGVPLAHPWLVAENCNLDAFPLIAQFRFAGMQVGDYCVFEDTHMQVAADPTGQEFGLCGWTRYKQLCWAMTAFPKEYEIDADITDMFGTNGSLMANSILRQVEVPAENVAATIEYSCLVSLEAAKRRIRSALSTHGHCLLRYTGADANPDTISQFVPSISDCLGIVSNVCYPSAGGTDAHEPVREDSGSGIVPTDLSPDAHIPPHHELRYTPNCPDRAGFVMLSMAEKGGETTVYDGLKALEQLELAAEHCSKHGSLVFRIRQNDHVSYRRVLSPPGTATTPGKIEDWSALFGDVDAEEALQKANDMGFKAEVLSSGELQVDFSHGLVCGRTGALNTSTCASSQLSYDVFYRDGSAPTHEKIWWASDGTPVTEEETMLMQAAYAQSKIFFKWRSPGDAILLNNHRMAHGRMPFKGGKRMVAQILGNTE